MYLYKMSSFGSLLVWSFQVWDNTISRRKNISNDFQAAIVADGQCEKGFKQTIWNNFELIIFH